MASTLEIKRKYRTYVLQKVATHFGVARVRAIANNNLEEDILRINGGEEFDFREAVYATHIDTLKLEEILYYDNFLKSKIYEEFVNGEGLADDFHYVMALHLNGLIFIIYRSDMYTGSGGIQLNNGRHGEGFVITPIKNYLNDMYPLPDSE